MRILVRILVEVSPNSIAVKLVLNVSILFQACSSVEGFERISLCDGEVNDIEIIEL